MLFSTHERLARSSIRAPAIGQLMDAPEIETSCKGCGRHGRHGRHGRRGAIASGYQPIGFLPIKVVLEVNLKTGLSLSLYHKLSDG